MAKILTKNIQAELLHLGDTLGFRAELEYSFTQTQGIYSPRYDVVWLLNVSQLQIETLKHITLIDEQYVPFAAFEIEGSTTSSKNQLGNIGNLRISPCYYNFIVVNNAAAAQENDTYRRCMKIVRTMQELMGEKNLFLLDSSMLKALPLFSKTQITVTLGNNKRQKGSGGEKGSLTIAQKIIQEITQTKLQIDFDRTPDYFKYAFHVKKQHLLSKSYTYDPVSFTQRELKTDTSFYYKPKIDIVAGFNIEGGFVEFLTECARRLQSDAVHFPMLTYMLDLQINAIYYPLLGIEIEMNESKHALGGLINLATFHQNGWLVAPSEMSTYVKTYKQHLGMTHVHHLTTEEL